MMAEMHRERDIGARQRVAAGIGAKDRNRRGDIRVRVDVHSDHADAQLVSHLLRNQPGGAAYIQHSTDRQGIPANGADNEIRIPHPMVNSGKIAVRTIHQFIGNAMMVQYFGLIRSYHPTEL